MHVYNKHVQCYPHAYLLGYNYSACTCALEIPIYNICLFVSYQLIVINPEKLGQEDTKILTTFQKFFSHNFSSHILLLGYFHSVANNYIQSLNKL